MGVLVHYLCRNLNRLRGGAGGDHFQRRRLKKEGKRGEKREKRRKEKKKRKGEKGKFS